MWLLSSLLAHTFASPCLGREPKAKVATLTFSSWQLFSLLFLWELKGFKQERSCTYLWLMRLLLPLISSSLEKYPLPTHNFFLRENFSKLPSFPLFELLVETIGSLVSHKISGGTLQLGFLQFYLDYLVRSSYDNTNLIMYPTERL